MSFITSSLEIIIYSPFANYFRRNEYSYKNREKKSHRFNIKSSPKTSQKNSEKKFHLVENRKIIIAIRNSYVFVFTHKLRKMSFIDNILHIAY